MRNKCKRLVAKCLVLVMVLGMLPNTSLNVKAASQHAPLKEISVEQVKNQGLPVINLKMADSSKYDTLKTVKDKQNIEMFTLYDVDGSTTEVGITTDKETGKKVYPLTVKGRGNSSWTMPTGKKPYNIKFEEKIDLLGMGKAKSWCLISNWVDTSYMRNYMAYNLACEMGMKTPDSRQIALCIDGKFEGIYLITEKVGLNEFRTEIPESPNDDDVNKDGETTEIIVESDSRAVDNKEPGRFETRNGVWFVPKDPERDELKDSEYEEIKKEVNAMETAIMTGIDYEKYIDVNSWVDTYIINELAKNPDFGFGYQPCYSSSYLYFREGGKVYAGPVWDFDIAYGRNDYSKIEAEGKRETANPQGYFTASTKYYKELIEKTDFMEHVIKRWNQLKGNGTLDKWLGEIYTKGHDGVKNLVQKDLDIWGGTEERVAGTFEVGRKALEFEKECDYIKTFMQNRIKWLDTQWKVDKVDAAYSDGTWSRTEVPSKNLNATYDELIANNKKLNEVWDGGFGYYENEEETETELGKPQGAIPPVAIEPITLKMDTSEITGNDPLCVKWYAQGEGGGIDSTTNRENAKRTIDKAGRYLGITAKTWYLAPNNPGETYSMKQPNDSSLRNIYVVDVGVDRTVTVHDGTIALSGKDWDVKDIDVNNHYGAVEKTDEGFVFKYQADGNGNFKVPGTGPAVDMKVNVVENGSTDLTVTKRAKGTRYPDTLDSFDATYIEVTDGMPESWTNSNPTVVAFDENTRKVTALKAGTSTITAIAGKQNVAVTFTVTEKQAAELSKVEVPTTGLYAPDYHRDPAPIAGSWATAASGQMYRFTYTLNLTKTQFENMLTIYMANDEKEQVISGQGEYRIYVNGNVWKEGSTTDLAAANRVLKNLMQEGENKVDIFMMSPTNAYLDSPYFYGERKIDFTETPTEPDPETPVESVTLDTTEVNLEEGETFQLTATVKPDNATNKKLTWKSSETAIATVDITGKITALKEGTTVITATSNNGKSASATITVDKKPEVQVEEIELNKKEVILTEGETETLTATVKPDNAADKTLTWTSSNEVVATVENGTITAVAPGKAIITVKSVNGITATANVTVNKKPDIEVIEVTLDKTEATLEECKTLQLHAIITPSNATNQTLTWKSSEKKVATVEDGKVTAVSEGTATITAMANNGKKASAVITVTKKSDAENGFTTPLTAKEFANREAFNVENPETVVASGIALLNNENKGLRNFGTLESEDLYIQAVAQTLAEIESPKLEKNSKSKGNANAEKNSNKNGNRGKGNGKGKGNKVEEILESSDKMTPTGDGVLLWAGESMAFAVKDYQATKQILHVEATSGELTFVTPGSEPQKLDIASNEVILPEIEAAPEGEYTYFLIANTGDSSITLKDIWTDKETKWKVSYETLPVMYEMNAVAFGKDVLEITEASLAAESVIVFNPVDFTVKTTASESVEDLIVIDRFYEDGLYGQLTKEVKILNNETIWKGQIRPDQFISTAFTFAVVDKAGNVSENPVKLFIDVTRY